MVFSEVGALLGGGLQESVRGEVFKSRCTKDSKTQIVGAPGVPRHKVSVDYSPTRPLKSVDWLPTIPLIYLQGVSFESAENFSGFQKEMRPLVYGECIEHIRCFW